MLLKNKLRRCTLPSGPKFFVFLFFVYYKINWLCENNDDDVTRTFSGILQIALINAI